jgi:hypothetical protein
MSFLRKIERNILRVTMEKQGVDKVNRKISGRYKAIKKRQRARGY